MDPIQHYYPKLKDKYGNKLKDENGKDKRSETSDGYTYTFVEFGTGKMVKLFYPQERQFEITHAYKVAGLGYDIKSANMILSRNKDKLLTTN